MFFGFFQDHDGSRSMSRLIIFMLMTAFLAVFVGSAFITWVHIPEVPAGTAALITGAIGLLYGINRFSPQAPAAEPAPQEKAPTIPSRND